MDRLDLGKAEVDISELSSNEGMFNDLRLQCFFAHILSEARLLHPAERDLGM